MKKYLVNISQDGIECLSLQDAQANINWYLSSFYGKCEYIGSNKLKVKNFKIKESVQDVTIITYHYLSRYQQVVTISIIEYE